LLKVLTMVSLLDLKDGLAFDETTKRFNNIKSNNGLIMLMI
jgi:hypothetical protein